MVSCHIKISSGFYFLRKTRLPVEGNVHCYIYPLCVSLLSAHFVTVTSIHITSYLLHTRVHCSKAIASLLELCHCYPQCVSLLPPSVEYWFRCMDIDGDGILSLYELQHFYEEMVDKMDALGIESLSIEDYMCQVRCSLNYTIHLLQ